MQIRAGLARSREFIRSRWMRRIGIAILVIVIIYGLAGFFAVPPILRHVLKGPVAASLNRHVTVRRIYFNPYTLRLDVGRFRIVEHGAKQAFVDIGRLRVKASWMSVLRLAPVVGEVIVDRPAVHLVRTAENRFNFSDLLEKPSTAPPAPSSKPLKFAISNIRLSNGSVHFDDQLLKQQHTVEHIELHIPFIANLPSDINVYVQPLLAMVVDGSRLRIDGKALPFASPPESVVNLNLHRFDLTRYLGYVPAKLPIKMPSGALSSALQVHFVNAPGRPLIRVGGEVALDKVEVHDAADAALLGLDHASFTLIDVEPLENLAHFEKIYLRALDLHVTRNHDGSINLASLSGAQSAPSKPAASPTPSVNQPSTRPGQITAGAPAPPSPGASPTPAGVSLDSFELADSTVTVIDNTGATPATLAIQAIHFGLKNLNTSSQAPPAPFDMEAKLGGGGSIATKGTVDVAHSQANTDITLNQIDLPALQGFAQSILAATIASGKLSASTKLATRFDAAHFNVHAEPASASLDNLEVRGPGGGDAPLKWKQFSVSVGQFDLASREALVKEVRLDGLHVSAKRDRDGQLNMAALIHQQQANAPQQATAAPSPKLPPSRQQHASRRQYVSRRPYQHKAPPHKAHPPSSEPGAGAVATTSPGWHYDIASVAVENTDARVEDRTTPEPLSLAVTPLNLHLHGISNDFAKPVALDLDGTVNGKGGFKVKGTVAPMPLKADFRIATRRLDLAPVTPLVSSHLNATIKSAALTMEGRLEAARERENLRLRYRGNATLGGVRMLDKLTNDLFLRWGAFSADGIDFAMASGPPRVHVRGVALANFYARIILNRDGHLNLSDVMANPQQAPTSLTRPDVLVHTQNPPPAVRPTPSAAPTPSAPSAQPQPLPANVAIGGIRFERGKVNYTDNFIRPNYSADLTDISGKVGSFGTSSTSPANVSLQAQLNGSSPIDIDGSVNPLTPMAFVDIKAKASGVELTSLSAYSTKYTGYPITKGTLNVDVHYLLDQQKLTAENHIFIAQLTFGDKVQNSTATNLPVRLAVSLLKNSRGEIDLRVPVSGSLSDPSFSLGSVILHAFMNIIVKAATAPFNLLASAFGGNANEDYGHILFDPGWATLNPTAQQKLDTLAKALQDRPALKLSITGRVDPKFDVEGSREAKLAKAVRAQKIEDLSDSEAANPASVKVTPAEYNKYLERAYKAAKFSKPRNAIGLTKSLPPDQMKKLMLENTQVTDKDLRDLADARANAVRRALVARKADPARLFETAPKLDASGIKDKDPTTRVDLSLE
jgi:uncharacterized protein involved in outer membrane biogenesis